MQATPRAASAGATRRTCSRPAPPSALTLTLTLSLNLTLTRTATVAVTLTLTLTLTLTRYEALDKWGTQLVALQQTVFAKLN